MPGDALRLVLVLLASAVLCAVSACNTVLFLSRPSAGEVGIPLCTTNRINTPETAEHILASGAADMVSMARPFLADPHFVKKAIEGRADEINTCIGCNQACLDHIFVNKKATCLVNPRAANETELVLDPVAPGKQQRIAVVGAGPAGLACASAAASRGHKVTLFERSGQIGGQFNLAKVVPGKEEFFETLRYFGKQLQLTGVDVRLNTEATARDLYGYDSVVVATGVTPREVKIPVRQGTTRVNVVSYVDVLTGKAKVGHLLPFTARNWSPLICTLFSDRKLLRWATAWQ
jgi:2,4-dienoyl-CoA reductase (NADPH2)